MYKQNQAGGLSIWGISGTGTKPSTLKYQERSDYIFN